MTDEIDKHINNSFPSIGDDHFAKLCYTVFIANTEGNLLMNYLFESEVLTPSSSPESNSVNPDNVLRKAYIRDYILHLLGKGKQYESYLKTVE